jgi:glycerol-3-phosphate acyltransferase PlsY
MYYDYLISAGAGYLLGSFNVGVLLSKYAYHDDVRNHGSGNAGATNMARTFGLKAGALTLGGDMLKGVTSMWLGLKLAGKPGLALAGASCVAGHCWPVYYGFKGGKGVAVGAAVALMIDPRVFLSAMGVFAAAAFGSKKVSVGSLSAAVTLPAFRRFIQGGDCENIIGIFCSLGGDG